VDASWVRCLRFPSRGHRCRSWNGGARFRLTPDKLRGARRFRRSAAHYVCRSHFGRKFACDSIEVAGTDRMGCVLD
jgi:hypothetical protein